MCTGTVQVKPDTWDTSLVPPTGLLPLGLAEQATSNGWGTLNTLPSLGPRVLLTQYLPCPSPDKG